MSKLYRIGLDIGIGSVGYAVLENNPLTENPDKILKLGVRTFSPNEVDKTGESSAKARREARGARRRKRRKEFRFQRMKNLLTKTFGENVLSEINLLNYGDKNKNVKPADVYEIRCRAISERVSDAELGKAILHLLKFRGFKSNRKNVDSKSDEGKLLKAINENTNYMAEKGYTTIGEMFFKDSKFFSVIDKNDKSYRVYNVRNHSGDYRNCFYRNELSNELELILKSQKSFGNEKITDEFSNKVLEIFNSQRNFDEGPGKNSNYSAKYEEGNCTFEKDEKRAPKASYTFELFNALSKINNLKIDGEELKPEQKHMLYEIIKEKEQLTYGGVRKKLGIEDNLIFNLCSYRLSKKEDNLAPEEYLKKCESKVFVSMKNSYETKKALNLNSSFDNRDILDEVANLLTHCKSDSTIDEYIKNNNILNQLTETQKEAIKTLSFDKFGSLSYKAMKKIEPYLFEGNRYDIACKKAGYNHSSFEFEKMKFLKGEEIDEMLQDVTNNVVKRSVNQTLRILNEIIKEYGSPQFVSIELARELGKNIKDRKRIQSSMQDRAEENEKIVKILNEDFKIVKPSGQDILKYKLYNEQNGKCMYSGKTIDINRLFEPNYLQIDHILPISKSMNDSYNNKVLVIADENQNKGNKTPFEYFGSDEKKWNEFVVRVQGLNNREKQRNLLKKTISEEDQKEFISRNINDTRYMSKLLLEIFDKYLLMAPVKQTEDKKRKVVYSVNGSITSYLRKCWAINKLREDGDIHHCIDAAIIATVDSSIIQKITKFNQFKEVFILHGDDKFISRMTGEVMSEQEKQEYEKNNINLLSKRLTMPYDWFLDELKIRSKVKYDSFEFDENEKTELAKLGYSDEELMSAKPVFVSRMKTVKATGPIHKDTLMSTREYNETQNLIKTVPLSKLNLKEKPEEIPLKDDKYPEFLIENYYRPKDDRLLYLKLKEYLKENGKIDDNVQFHKPKKDGFDGPIVKKVKVYEKATSCVITPNGAAENSTMFRVDVFEKNGKFYLCPIYMSDVYAHKLPNKVIEIGKDWSVIDDSFNFKFSLYKNDLVKVTSRNQIVLSKNFKNDKSEKPDKIISNKFLLYYISTGISVASVKLVTHDNCYKVDSLGVKTLENLEKYYVDITGKIYKAPKEERKSI